MAVRTLLLSAGVITVLLSATSAQTPRPSADWPQWRGANRDGIVTSWVEPKAWPDKLTAKWKVPIGLGYASPIVVGDRVFMFTRQETDEVLQAIDAATGKPIWQARYPAPFKMSSAANRHGDGPKATPTFSAGKLYTLGMGGVVSAFDAATGKQLWQTGPSAAPAPLYGTAMSPLVDRGLVIVHVGGHDKGALTAYDPNTGAVKWRWDGDGPAYNSPIAVDLGGTRQVVTFTQDNLIGVAQATGALLWQRPYKTRSTQNTITPIVFGDTLIVSGLDMPVVAIRVTKGAGGWTTEDVWSNPDVPLYMSNAVIAGDMLVGMTHKNSGQFFALDAKTGKTLWTSEPRQATNAAILRVGTQIFALKDDAELLVLSPSRTAFEPVHRYTVADSATWAQPTVSGNRIYVKDLNSLALFTIE